jgi:plasmid replication initiation protein
MKSKTPKIYKSKKLNNANFGTFNLNDYQVFLTIISKLGKVDDLGKYRQPEQLEREHTLTAKEFQQVFNVPNAYPILKRAGTKLMQSFITLEKPELFETWQIAICETAKYNQREGSITILFTQSIMPYLAQVKDKFVLYNLKEIANFGSLYSTRLYEKLQEYKDTGVYFAPVENLREMFAVGKKYKTYGEFKRFTFAHAVDEINSQYDMNLKFEELNEDSKPVKIKQKVTAVNFTFNKTFTRKTINLKTGQERNIYIKPKKKLPANDQLHPDQQQLDI